jgi:nucleotide-binding universal stress UspA family protein
VLVAYDGSPQAAKTLHAFQASGAAAGRPIHLLRVCDDPRDRHDLELAADYLKLHGHDAMLHVLASQTTPATVILAEARRLAAGLIVMGAFGRPRLAEFLFGSVTKTVLRDSTVPLLLYH